MFDEFAIRMGACGSVEDIADRIAALSDDPDLRSFLRLHMTVVLSQYRAY